MARTTRHNLGVCECCGGSSSSGSSSSSSSGSPSSDAVKDCCYECSFDFPDAVYPERCDECPEGYVCEDRDTHVWCAKYTPIECGSEPDGGPLPDHLEAERDCTESMHGGGPMGRPCPEPGCCLVCEIPGPPPEQCPDGFFFPNGVDGLCQKYFPTDCSEEEIAEAARQCAAAGGAAVAPPDGPCPEPPPATSCTPPSCPPDKYCTFIHPDCGPGECCPTGVWDTLEEAQGVAAAFPYDAFSKQACEQWYRDNYPGPCEESRATSRERSAPFPAPSSKPPAPKGGAGTELKKLLGKLGIRSSPSCRCNARAREMDNRGVAWVEANQATVLEWLREESRRRRLPFVPAVGRALIRRAIKNARAAGYV